MGQEDREAQNSNKAWKEAQRCCCSWWDEDQS